VSVGSIWISDAHNHKAFTMISFIYVIIYDSSWFFGLFEIDKSESKLFLFESEAETLNKSSTFLGFVQILFIQDFSKNVFKLTNR